MDRMGTDFFSLGVGLLLINLMGLMALFKKIFRSTFWTTFGPSQKNWAPWAPKFTLHQRRDIGVS